MLSQPWFPAHTDRTDTKCRKNHLSEHFGLNVHRCRLFISDKTLYDCHYKRCRNICETGTSFIVVNKHKHFILNFLKPNKQWENIYMEFKCVCECIYSLYSCGKTDLKGSNWSDFFTLQSLTVWTDKSGYTDGLPASENTAVVADSCSAVRCLHWSLNLIYQDEEK